jgi:hypothetical protein
MEPSTSPAAERESRLLLFTAAGLGCLLLICVLTGLIIVGLALLWTAQGQLGPGGLAPSALALLWQFQA